MKIQTIILTKLIAIVTLSFGAMALNANQWDGSTEVTQLSAVNSSLTIDDGGSVDYPNYGEFDGVCHAPDEENPLFHELNAAIAAYEDLSNVYGQIEYELMILEIFYLENYPDADIFSFPDYVEAFVAWDDAFIEISEAEMLIGDLEYELYGIQYSVPPCEHTPISPVIPEEPDYPPQDHDNVPMIAVATPLDYCNTYPDDEYPCG